MNTPLKHPKYAIPVRAMMTDKTQLLGVLFVRQNQRIIDLLCDARSFIPLETTAGLRLLNKQHVIQIDLMPIDEITEKHSLFPDLNFQYLHNNTW